MVLLALAACTAAEPEPAATDDVPACAGQPGGRVDECPGDFTLPTLDGGAFTLSDHAGTVVVVHLAEGNATDEGAARFLDAELDARPDVVGLEVLTPATEADAEAWRDRLGLALPVAWDGSGTFAADWARTSLFPTILVLDGTGRVTARMHEQYEGQLPAALP